MFSSNRSSSWKCDDVPSTQKSATVSGQAIKSLTKWYSLFRETVILSEQKKNIPAGQKLKNCPATTVLFENNRFTKTNSDCLMLIGGG